MSDVSMKNFLNDLLAENKRLRAAIEVAAEGLFEMCESKHNPEMVFAAERLSTKIFDVKMGVK